MPYINPENRYDIVKYKKGDTERVYPVVEISDISNAGEFQYAVAHMIKNYIKRKGLNYQNCNDIMGALAGAQMEFYRRVVGPYEDTCIERNGDV